MSSRGGNSNNSSTAWRKPGEELRAQLLRQDTDESQLILKPDCPMSRYIQVSERVCFDSLIE